MNDCQRALETVNDCLRAGVGEFVICAGARNAVLVEVLSAAERHGRVRLWTHFEERSAGFFALGRTMETGAPCAVVTTSGTAVAELLPAVVEAHYQARPLVVISADRPEGALNSGAPQTIDQNGIFGVYADGDSLRSWTGNRPFHLNVCFGEFSTPDEQDLSFLNDQEVFVQKTEFQSKKESLNVAKLARWLQQDVYRGIVVMVGGLEPSDKEEVFGFCQDFGVPVVADATSGLREALGEQLIHNADRVLRERPPGKVLRLGEVPVGRFWRDLEDLPEVEVWSICRNGLRGLARPAEVTRGGVARVLRALGHVAPADDALDHLVGNSAREARVDELLEAFPDSEPGLMRALSCHACLGDGVFLGNSLPIREWNSFAQRMQPMVHVRANRGANGIDGQVSTWLGWSAEQEGAWAILGDLTTLYDMAAFHLLGQVECRGRVLAVVNNRGGRIFDQVASLKSMSDGARGRMRNAHEADFESLARLWGMDFLRVKTADDFDAYEPGERPMLMEIVPDERQTADFWVKMRS